MILTIVPFEKEKHLQKCAELVASRFFEQHLLIPHMPTLYCSPEPLQERISEITAKCPAVVALKNGLPVGFLGGFVSRNLRGRQGIFIPEWGHAAAGTEDVSAIYRSMYGALSSRWAANGCFTQAIMVLANEHKAQDALFWLGFGMVGADAVRGLDPASGITPGITIRQINADDGADLNLAAMLGEGLGRQLAEAPTFLPFITKETPEDRRTWLSQPKHTFWAAFLGNNPVGYMQFEPSNPKASGIIRDVGTISITGAYTCKEARGKGIGTALLNRGLKWARNEGFSRCAVDFESANNAGVAFWLRHFQPISVSVFRFIDERLAWANENRKDENIW